MEFIVPLEKFDMRHGTRPVPTPLQQRELERERLEISSHRLQHEAADIYENDKWIEQSEREKK